jgi:hypothetical protein
VNKQPAPKVAASNIQEIQTNLDKEYSEARIKQLEDKLKERDEKIMISFKKNSIYTKKTLI